MLGRPTYRIKIPTLHASQARVYNRRARRNAIRCGRRWGKTKQIVTLASNAAAKGLKVGIFAPEHKQWTEIFEDIKACLAPILSRVNKSDGILRTITGGHVDFWHLTGNDLAARGREYDLILIDEAAFTKDNEMLGIWEKSIVPTMATRPDADVWIFSTPNGMNPENFFWLVCNDPGMGFKQFHQPSSSNPIVSKEWLETERARMHPSVYAQEILAEWVDWSGIAFFGLDKWLLDGFPVQYPTHCDSVFAVIDSAIKTGSANDGTAVSYYARNKYHGTPVILLDWDIVQIEADLLTTWVPNVVLPRVRDLAQQCGAREGVKGVWVEDKGSGTVLLQRAARASWPLIPIDSKFTALGKDERAIAVSGHHYNGKCIMSEFAHNKTVNYKGVTRNHMITQVTSYRLGDKDAAKRADDLMDTYCYGLFLALGIG